MAGAHVQVRRTAPECSPHEAYNGLVKVCNDDVFCVMTGRVVKGVCIRGPKDGCGPLAISLTDKLQYVRMKSTHNMRPVYRVH